MGGYHQDLESFFTPAGVVLIGASRDPAKLGYGVARNLVRYPGAVHFVNPAGGELFGRVIHPTVASVPDPVELAVVLIPAPDVPAAVGECGERGIKSIIVTSGGFRESGERGAELERSALETARRYGMRMLGPNCIGTIDTHSRLDTTFLRPPRPDPGEVAFVSHSGATCAAVIDWARGRGFGLSRVISLGNQADLTETDALEQVATDPATRVVTLYLEGVADGSRFLESAAAIDKPIVAMKVGRSAGGRRAAASHTGALAGRDAAYSAAFRKAGVLRPETGEELLEWARALAWAKLPAGRRVVVLTNAGGPGVAAADAVERAGLRLAALNPATRRALAGILPEAAAVANPVDMLASASPGVFAECSEVLLGDPGVDAMLVVFPPPPMFPPAAVAGALVPVIAATPKPVLVALMGDRTVEDAAVALRQARVLDFRFPESAAAVLAMLADFAETKAMGDVPPIEVSGVAVDRAGALVEGAQPGWLNARAAIALAVAYGIPVPPARAVDSEPEAVRAAEEIGYPVAVKVDSPDVLHKSAGGGVRLGLTGRRDVESAFRTVRSAAGRAHEGHPGVLVQAMVGPGDDVIAGCVRDPQFGPLVMFGTGGVEVEETGDVQFALGPLTRRDIDHLLGATRAGRRLAGLQSRAPAARQEVEGVVVRLARLVADHPAVQEVEVNPLRVGGAGVSAIDVRVRIGHKG